MKAFLLVNMLLLAAVQLSGQEYIDYEMFGAVGDGVTDDQESIALAHDAANEKGLPVKVNSGKTYYIGGGDREIVIRTDTDFGEAHFIIDDRNVKDREKDIFIARSAKEAFDISCKPLKKDDRKLRCGKLPCDCVVEIFNDEKKIYIRKGLNRNKGTAQQEVLLVNRKGKILSPVKWDYDKITRARAFPTDDDTLRITGGVFTTIANQAESRYNYHSRGIHIHRSNVIVENVRHFVEGELDHGAPYSGFISITASCGVTVRDCIFTAHKTYWTTGSAGKPVRMGSYDLEITRSINVAIRNCSQTTDIDNDVYWGLMASNFCKGIKLDGCRFSRFDAHQGVMDVTLENCVFGHMATRAVGSGSLLIRNCEIRANYLFSLRDDYGSTWDGEIVIKDCVLRPQEEGPVRIINGSNNGDHDFGYPCRLPQRVIVQRLFIDDSKIVSTEYGGPTVFARFTQDKNAGFPILREGEVVVQDIRTSSGKDLKISDEPAGFTGYVMSVE